MADEVMRRLGEDLENITEEVGDLLDILRLMQQTHGNNSAPAASKKVVATLPQVVIEKKEGECSICLKPWKSGVIAKEMPCKHTFHRSCILPWLKKTNSCPVCRHELPTDDPVYEENRKYKKREAQRQQELELLHNSMYS